MPQALDAKVEKVKKLRQDMTPPGNVGAYAPRIPGQSITVDGGPMPTVDPLAMQPDAMQAEAVRKLRGMIPVSAQGSVAPPQGLSDDAMLLEKVKQLRGTAPQADVIRPSQAMYPMNRAAGMQAQQLEAQAMAPRRDPFANLSGWKRMLAQGMLGAAEGSAHAQDPGGYSGWRQRQDQIEQQAKDSQLEQVRSLRNEQLQRERMYQDELQGQIGREDRQREFDADQAYRNETLMLAKAKELRESQPQDYTLNPGDIRFRDREEIARGRDPLRTTSIPASIQTYQLWASQQPQGADTSYEGFLRAQEAIKARIAQQFKTTNPTATEFLYNLYQNDPDGFDAIANRSRIPTTEDVLRLARDPLTGEIDLEAASTIQSILRTGQLPATGTIGGAGDRSNSPVPHVPAPAVSKPTTQYQRGQRISMADGSVWEVTGFKNGEPLIRQVGN